MIDFDTLNPARKPDLLKSPENSKIKKIIWFTDLGRRRKCEKPGHCLSHKEKSGNVFTVASDNPVESYYSLYFHRALSSNNIVVLTALILCHVNEHGDPPKWRFVCSAHDCGSRLFFQQQLRRCAVFLLPYTNHCERPLYCYQSGFPWRNTWTHSTWGL